MVAGIMEDGMEIWTMASHGRRNRMLGSDLCFWCFAIGSEPEYPTNEEVVNLTNPRSTSRPASSASHDLAYPAGRIMTH